MDELTKWAIAVAAGIVIAVVAVHVFWRLRSAIRIWRAGRRELKSVRAVIWRDPGIVEALDLAAGPGGPDGDPTPPFTFIEEHFEGSRPCVSVRDVRGRRWRLKWGDEVQVEALATRLAWAAGYFVEVTYYVAQGTVAGAHSLKRANACLDASGTFTAARFELEEESVIKHFEEHSWAWNDNPFVGTRELNGLKIVMMWLSNWDAKDVRDVARGSNTAIFEHSTAGGRREARYLITDWGGALGRWGNVVNRGRWDSEGFAEQTPFFVTGLNDDLVEWGYSGQRTADIAAGITVRDVEWLLGYLGRLRPLQIAAAVRASGGTAEEEERFTRALVDRIGQLRHIVGTRSAQARNPVEPAAGVPSITTP